jgi:hypothetical protein
LATNKPGPRNSSTAKRRWARPKMGHIPMSATFELKNRVEDCMTISLKKLKAVLLANPKVKAEYDALALEFEISVEPIKPSRS